MNKLFELEPTSHFLNKESGMDLVVADYYSKGLYRKSTTRKGAVNYMRRALAKKLYTSPNEIEIDPWIVVEVTNA